MWTLLTFCRHSAVPALNMSDYRETWYAVLNMLPDKNARTLAGVLIPKMVSALVHCPYPAFSAYEATGTTHPTVKLYDFCFKYLPVAEAKEQATKVMDGVFDNSLEKRAARGWWDENDYLERMPHIRKLLKGKGFTAQDSPYKGYAAMLLKAISKKRNLDRPNPVPKVTDALSYAYPAPECTCTECATYLRDFLPNNKKISIQHIGNERGRKHLIEVAGKAGRIKHTVEKPTTRLLLTITKQVSAGDGIFERRTLADHVPR